MLLDVIHPGEANVSKKDLREIISKKYKVNTANIVLYGFKTQYGGGKSTGFCIIYDTMQYLLKFEPKFRLRKMEILPKKTTSRKAMKDIKSKCKKTRGKEITKLMTGKI